MEIKDLRKLSGLNECAMTPAAPINPPSPASISMTAASGSELSSMLKDIMSLAGMSKVEPAQLGVVPPPMKMSPEPVKAVGPAAGDGEVMRGIADKLNLDKDDKPEEGLAGAAGGAIAGGMMGGIPGAVAGGLLGSDLEQEEKADEAYDNVPADPMPKEKFDAEEFANHENPPGAGKGRRTMQPNATVEEVSKQLFADYQNFLAESDEVEESGLQYHTGVKKHGKDYMDKAAAAGRAGASQEELGRLKDKYSKAYKEDGELGESPEENENLTLAMSALNSAADDLYEAGFSEEAEQVLRIYHDLEEKTQTGDETLPEEKSWFDMTSKERAAHVASGKSKAHKSGGQPGHGPAPAKTSKGDVMHTAKDVKSHSEKEPSGDKEDN